MGIESDKLVFDYLSRIGDLAHGTTMTAAERARLVGGLRGEIDRMRAEQGGAQSKAAVKKILARLGRPEEVVAARGSAGGTGGSGAGGGFVDGTGGSSGFGGGSGSGGGDGGTYRKISLRKRPEPAPPSPPPATASYGASAPHLAGMDELGPEESDPDWWRVDPSPYGDGGGSRTFGGPVPGFVGGIEVPELLKPPPGAEEEQAPKAEGGKGPRWRIPLPGARKAPDDKAAGPAGGGAAPGPGGGPAVARAGGVVEWTAAALLVAGAAIGSLVPLGLGWLAAWWSPRLTRTEAKWAAAGMPGLVAAGTAVWLWGRIARQWGPPLAEGGKQMGDALTDAGPVVLRVAAVASALFLAWRARRPRM